jgi:hypothetical protein
VLGVVMRGHGGVDSITNAESNFQCSMCQGIDQSLAEKRGLKMSNLRAANHEGENRALAAKRALH